MQSISKDLKVHQNSNLQSGSSLGSVKVHSLTLSYIPKSMKCDSWTSLLARTFTSPYLSREPKARVATKQLTMFWLKNLLCTKVWLSITKLIRLIPRLLMCKLHIWNCLLWKNKNLVWWQSLLLLIHSNRGKKGQVLLIMLLLNFLVPQTHTKKWWTPTTSFGRFGSLYLQRLTSLCPIVRTFGFEG
jgi:hypothetical protein